VPHNQLFARLLALTALGIAGRLPAQNVASDAAHRVADQRLRPGDAIQVQFPQDRELNTSVVVNELGQAVFPKLGSIDVTQLTIGGLPDTLRSRYAAYLRDPSLDVAVLRRVTVNGEVRLPSVYMLEVTSTVRDAIARAGGLSETAKRNDVVIVRGSERIHVSDWQTSTGPVADLLSGDQVIVGRKSWLELNALSVISTSVIVVGLIQSLRR
jgi:protein involved in polysaccharide export with SLBB domain